MNWNVKYLPEALDDLRKLDGSQKFWYARPFKKSVKIPFLRQKAVMENSWEIKAAIIYPVS